MQTIQVMKTKERLSKVSCSCGYFSYSDNANSLDYLTWNHSLKHKKVNVEIYIEGVFQDPNRKTAKPGRPNGKQQG